MSLFRKWQQRSLGEIYRSWWAALPKASELVPDQIVAHDAKAICHRCFSALSGAEFFCLSCGTAVGPYNNILPFIRVFSLGEVLRSGVLGDRRHARLERMGYLILPLLVFGPIAPLYWTRYVLAQTRAARRIPRPEGSDELTRLAGILWSVAATDLIVIGGMVFYVWNLDAFLMFVTWPIPVCALAGGIVGVRTTVRLLRRPERGPLPGWLDVLLVLSALALIPGFVAAIGALVMETAAFLIYGP